MTQKLIIIPVDNEGVIETDGLIYTPIKNLIFEWSIDRSANSKWMQKLYLNDKNRDRIVGLVVSKETGDWAFAVDDVKK